MIFLVHYNHDYHESMSAHFDLTVALREIRAAFEVEVEISHPEFADEVMESYENSNWKGFTMHALDPATGALVEIGLNDPSLAEGSAHARLAYIAKLRKELATADPAA